MRHAKKKSRKKYLWLISLVIAAICFFVWKNNFNSNRMPSNYHADQVDLNVKAAVAINAKDGSTIYAKNANQSLPIASMTKLLTVYLTLQAIKEKKISWDTTVTPTQEIVDLGSNPDYASVPLRLGQKYTVRELYDAALIKSANNAARLLAIAVSGSETNFLNQMRQQARKWKLNNAKFVTVDGLPEKKKNFLGMTTTVENKMSATTSGYVLPILERWGKDDPQVLEESIQASLQESKRMKHLIQEMLDLTRAEQVDLQYPDKTTDVNEVLNRTVNDMRMIHQDFTITYDDADLKPDTIVKIYRNHLEQILIILIDNAIKYSTNRKEILVAAATEKDKVKISVQDFGEGIAPDEQDKIFNRFYRVDKARTREKGGNGLGLAIAQKLVESYHGKISVSSTLGSGSKFMIEFPLLKSESDK